MNLHAFMHKRQGERPSSNFRELKATDYMLACCLLPAPACKTLSANPPLLRSTTHPVAFCVVE